MRRRLWALAAVSVIAVASAARAQPPIPPTVTDITADTGQLSLGTNVTTNGTLTTIDGGTRAGANLFHSFSRFDVGNGDTARFVATDPATIGHVVSRVTGGQFTAIAGTIDSTAIPNADFWFINPAGIVFRPGAQLNVPAAARFSTASELRFVDAPAFAVTTPGGSTLSVAPPAAFGFLGGEQGITVRGADRSLLPDGGRLTLAGADVAIVESDLAGGVFQLLGAGGEPIEVTLEDPLAAPLAGRVTVEASTLRLDGAALGTGGIRIGGGEVELLASQLGTAQFNGPDQGISGPITIQGDIVRLSNSTISASTFGPESAAPILITGGEISISASAITNDARLGSTGEAGVIGISGEQVDIDASFVTSSTQTEQSGGGIAIEANSIVIRGGSLITSSTLEQATGDAGAIILGGGSLDLSGASAITSQTLGQGNAGAILIELAGLITLDGGVIESAAAEDSTGNAGLIGIVAPSLTLRNEAFISTDTFGAGAGGLIGIEAAEILIDSNAFISASSELGGDGGGIAISAESLVLDNGGRIRTNTLGTGEGGAIEIEAGEIVLARGAAISSNVTDLCSDETCAPTGGSGNILITAGRLNMVGFANFEGDPTTIRTDGSGSRAAGSITLRLGALVMSGLAGIEADNLGSGAGGLVSIEAGDISLRDTAFISTGSFDVGPGGDIAIVADTLLLEGDASIRSESLARFGGPAGSILINAGSTVIRESRLTTSSRGDGDAGLVQILGARLENDRGEITSSTQGAGRAGDILIDVDEVVVSNEGRITSDSNQCFFTCASSGDAGSVTIVADSLTMTGDLVQSFISSRTQTTGNSGDIIVRVGVLDMTYAAMSSTTVGIGDAGRIDIEADEISLSTSASITSRAVPFFPDESGRSGNAGSVRIVSTGQMIVTDDSLISTQTDGTGDAGTIEIVAPSLILRERSLVTSATFASGQGGSVSIEAGNLLIDSLAAIDSQAGISATGSAGLIEIEADRLAVINGGRIASDTLGFGQGGAIIIEAGEVDIATDGSITSDSAVECAGECAPAGNAGDIIITADILRIRGNGEFGAVPSRAISSDTTSDGAAGRIVLLLGSLDMNGNGYISSDTLGSGAGGFISVTADTVAMRNNAFISTGAFGAGAGGAIFVEAASVLLEDDASIISQSRSQDGARGGLVVIDADSTVIRRAEINSSGLGNGDAGSIELRGNRLELDLGAILSDTQGAGRGGDIRIDIRDVLLRNGSLIAADSLGCFAAACDSLGDAGSVSITATSLTMTGNDDPVLGLQTSRITSETATEGDAGDITLRLGRLDMDIATISSGTRGVGDAGTVDIEANQVDIANFSQIETRSQPLCTDGACDPVGNAGSIRIAATGAVSLSAFSAVASNAFGIGDAGAIAIQADSLSLQRARITTASEIGATGSAGNIAIDVAGTLRLADGSELSSEASNASPAGAILVQAGSVRIEDPNSAISSANNEEGAAGAVLIFAGALDLVEGGRISTSSSRGAAGDIGIVMPQGSLLRLTGRRFVSEITTSSGPGTGGQIAITNPYAIISDGGSILALGLQGGANVQIQTGFFIRSADRLNRVAVDGDFLLEAQAGDVSSGTVERDLSILDASGVLRGQCSAARSSGQVSQLVVRPVGPYGRGGGPSTTPTCE